MQQVIENPNIQTYEQVEVEVLEEGIWCNDELIEELPAAEQKTNLMLVATKEAVATQAAGAKSHVCDICGNSYPRKSTLDTHMRRHKNERPYECE